MSSRGAAKKLSPVKPRAAAKKAPPSKSARPKPAAKVAHLPKPKTAAKKPAPARKPAAVRPAPAPPRPPAPPLRQPVVQRAFLPQRPLPGPGAPQVQGYLGLPRPAGTVPPRPTPIASTAPPLKRPALAATPLRPPLPPKQQATLARSYFWSDLRVGDDLPPLAKPPIDRVQIARYSAAAGDFNRLHLDEPYATALGYRGAFAPGALAMGFVAQLLTQWLRRGHVRKLSARFVKIVRPGDELACRGRVAELRKEKSACWAELELWAENQKGELVLRGHATCELYESPASLAGESGLFPGGGRPPASAPRTQLPPLRKLPPPPLKAPPKKK